MTIHWRAAGAIFVTGCALGTYNSHISSKSAELSKKLQKYPQKSSDGTPYNDPYLSVAAQTDCLALLRLSGQEPSISMSEVRRCERLKIALIHSCMRLSIQELEEIKTEPVGIKKMLKLEELRFRCFEMFRLSVESCAPLVESLQDRKELTGVTCEFFAASEQSKELMETVTSQVSEEITDLVDKYGARV